MRTKADRTDQPTEQGANQPQQPKKRTKHGGRKKGTPNKVTKDLRGWLVDVLNDHRDTIQTDLMAIVEPEKRLMIFEKLMQYVIPKQQAVRAEITQMTEADINEVTTRLLESLNTDEDEQSDEGGAERWPL